MAAKHHPPILPKHMKVPDWSKMTYREQSDHRQSILDYFLNPETNEVDEDHPEHDKIIALFGIHTPPELLARRSS